MSSKEKNRKVKRVLIDTPFYLYDDPELALSQFDNLETKVSALEKQN